MNLNTLKSPIPVVASKLLYKAHISLTFKSKGEPLDTRIKKQGINMSTTVTKKKRFEALDHSP